MMKNRSHVLATAVLCVLVTARAGICEDRGAVALPPGVKAVWDLDKAFREKTPTRERICINGLWRWQPARNAKGLVTADNPLTGDISVPNGQWAYFKVPGNFADSTTICLAPSYRPRKCSAPRTTWACLSRSPSRTWVATSPIGRSLPKGICKAI